MTLRSPAKCETQNGCVRMTAAEPLGRYSSAANKRPSAGRRPSVSPNDSPASTVPTRSGSGPACTVAPLMSKNAIETSERVSRRRSVMSSWFTTIAVGASRTGDERRTSCSGAGRTAAGAAGRR